MARVIVLDTETTGLDPTSDQIVELAAIGVDLKHEVFETLVDPCRDIPPEAMAVHHITEKMCRGKPVGVDAVGEMLAFMDFPEVIVAHNAKFDRAFIEALAPPNYKPKWICTYKSAQVIWPNAPRHTNQVLRYWLGLNPNLPDGLAPHRALYDILVTREIFQSLLTFKTINELHQISSNPVLLTTCSFGKHKGKPWSQVDRGYLQWIVRQPEEEMNEDVRFTAQHYLRGSRG